MDRRLSELMKWQNGQSSNKSQKSEILNDRNKGYFGPKVVKNHKRH